METITGLESNDNLTVEDALEFANGIVNIAVNKKELLKTISKQAENLVQLADLPWDKFRVDQGAFQCFIEDIQGFHESTGSVGPGFIYKEQETTYKIASFIVFTSETSLRCELTFAANTENAIKIFNPETKEWTDTEIEIPGMQGLSDKQKEYLTSGSPDAEFVYFCNCSMVNLNDEYLDYYMSKYARLRELHQKTKNFMEFIVLNNEEDVDSQDVMIGIVPRNPEIYGFAVGLKEDSFVVLQYLEENCEDGAYYLREVAETNDMEELISYLREMADHYTDEEQFIIPLSLKTYTKDSNINNAGSTVYTNKKLDENEEKNQLAIMEFIAMLMANQG